MCSKWHNTVSETGGSIEIMTTILQGEHSCLHKPSCVIPFWTCESFFLVLYHNSWCELKHRYTISRPLITRWYFTAFPLKAWRDDGYSHVETHAHGGCTHCHFVATSGDRIKKNSYLSSVFTLHECQHVELQRSCMILLSINMTVARTWRQRKQN